MQTNVWPTKSLACCSWPVNIDNFRASHVYCNRKSSNTAVVTKFATFIEIALHKLLLLARNKFDFTSSGWLFCLGSITQFSSRFCSNCNYSDHSVSLLEYRVKYLAKTQAFSCTPMDVLVTNLCTWHCWIISWIIEGSLHFHDLKYVWSNSKLEMQPTDSPILSPNTFDSFP